MSTYDEAMKLLDEKLGNKDGLISLSTIALEPGTDGKSRPAARIVDAYYEDGAFYTVTYTTSGKMLQIAQNPEVAVVGYVMKNAASRELIHTIHSVMREQIVLPDAIVQALRKTPSTKQVPDPESRLTRREFEIIQLIATGLSNEEIAEKLVISKSTVGVHIGNILNKLGLENRTQAALYALRHGWADDRRNRKEM